MWNEGFVSEGNVSKRARPSERARGQEFEHLPFGMGGEPGPTAYRHVEDPLARLAASNIRADAIGQIIREMRRPWYVPANKKKRREAVRRLDIVGGEGVVF
jgi:hypothetical protein